MVDSSSETAKRLPDTMLWTVLFLCAAPFVAQLSGVDLGSRRATPNVYEMRQMAYPEMSEVMIHALPGPFSHVVIAWTATIAALAAGCLSMLRARSTDRLGAAILGVALVASGICYGFHALVSSALWVPTEGTLVELSAWTWALARSYVALAFIAAVALVLYVAKRPPRSQTRVLGLTLAGFIGVAVLAIVTTFLLETVPSFETEASGVLRRPVDVAVLVLVALAGIIALPRLYSGAPSYMGHAMWLSAVPLVAGQAHLAFGSSVAFDSHANAGHMLAMLALLLPLWGCGQDLLDAQRHARDSSEALEKSEAELREDERALESLRSELRQTQANLQVSNNQLEDLISVITHDLREPLAKLQFHGDELDAELSGLSAAGTKQLGRIRGAAYRMQTIVDNLLSYAARGDAHYEALEVDLGKVIDRILADHAERIADLGARIEIGVLPVIHSDPKLVWELLHHVISNALEFVRPNTPPVISIEARREPDEQGHMQTVIKVVDNGIGFASEDAERIFKPFERLSSRATVDRSGMGLALCRRIVARHCGAISAEGRPGKGAKIRIRLPDLVAPSSEASGSSRAA